MLQPWTTGPAKLLIYFHGVGEDINDVQNETYLMNNALRVNVLAVEYPGYGLNWSEGICSEKRMIEDAKRVLSFILENTKLNMSDIIIFGRSMGTGIATALAKEFKSQRPAALILLSPFESLKSVILHHIGRVFSCLIQD